MPFHVAYAWPAVVLLRNSAEIESLGGVVEAAFDRDLVSSCANAFSPALSRWMYRLVCRELSLSSISAEYAVGLSDGVFIMSRSWFDNLLAVIPASSLSLHYLLLGEMLAHKLPCPSVSSDRRSTPRSLARPLILDPCCGSLGAAGP